VLYQEHKIVHYLDLGPAFVRRGGKVGVILSEAKNLSSSGDY